MESRAAGLFDTSFSDPQLSGRALCEALIRADTEAEVEDVLREAGYWDDIEAWSVFGDSPGLLLRPGRRRDAHLGLDYLRFVFETDAKDDYFDRGDAPEIREVREEQWDQQVPEPFNGDTDLRRVDGGNGVYELRYNADNKWLRKELSRSKASEDQAADDRE